MPFKQVGNQKVWVPKSKEELDSFVPELDKQEVSTEFSTKVQNQLNSLASQILQGNQRLINSNISRANSLVSLSTKGIQAVDVIIPVYGGLQVLIPCLNAINKRTFWPFKITIVDDCSPDSATKNWLLSWQKENKEHQVIFHIKNKGFASAVNTGIKNTNTPYICILNSDVIVTERWLTKMVMALEADQKNKIVNPITNNTALISVPLQPGYDYQDMNKAFELSSQHKYPEILPTGFCYMFARELVKKIGLFDESYQKGYGEETDHFMRTITNIDSGFYGRWRAVLADNTYVFHERGSSFGVMSTDEHLGLRKAGSERFHAVWPQFKQWQSSFDLKKSIGPLKQPFSKEIIEKKQSRYNIAFVVYSTAYCGGMKVISDIVNELNERGINAKVVQIKRNKKSNTTPLPNLRTGPIVFENSSDFIDNFATKVFDIGFVVAGTGELMNNIGGLCLNTPSLVPVHFAQSDEEAIAPDGLKKICKDSLKLAKHTITVSKWLKEKLSKDVEVSGYVHPGYDNRVFYPRNRAKGDDRPTALFLLGPDEYPFKGATRALKVCTELWELAKNNNKDIRILALGRLSIPSKAYITCLGDNINPARLANLLGSEVDILCDPSVVHSFGLPALEAMASGVVPVCWNNKGITEYATHFKDSIICPEGSSARYVAKQIFSILDNPEKKNRMAKAGVKTAEKYHRDKAIPELIKLFEQTLDVEFEKKTISVVTPHLRKYGGPTTILNMANILYDAGHDVVLYSIYPDILPELEKQAKMPIRLDYEHMRACDILISNSDNPHNKMFTELPQVKKKIMFKLSHNERFKVLEQESLNLKWDKIVTSTQWLADVCKTPPENWDYKPCEAERVGWNHYSYETFHTPMEARKFGSLKEGLVIATLAHQHPLKGTNVALESLRVMKQKYQNRVNIITVGEWPNFKNIKPDWVSYVFGASREEMAKLMSNIDIWVVASHTEGLGRLGLEAMSAGCALIASDTGIEYAQHEKNCLVTKINDVDDLSISLDRLIQDNNFRKSLVSEGYNTALKFANPKEYTYNWLKIIKELF